MWPARGREGGGIGHRHKHLQRGSSLWVGVWVSEKGDVGWPNSPSSLCASLKTQKEQNLKSQSQAKKVTCDCACEVALGQLQGR